MSEIAAKLRGTVKQAATVLKGQTGIYATLAKEHGEVTSLLKQAEYTADSDVRHQLLRTIRHELTAHARAEERTFYEALTRFDSTRSRAAHGQSEHDEIERLLRDIFLFELGSEAATRAIADLRSFVSHHIAEEESDLFPRAQAVIHGEDARRLDERFREEKDRELRRLDLEVIV